MTLTKTLSALGCGFVQFTTCSTAGPPNRSKAAACIVAPMLASPPWAGEGERQETRRGSATCQEAGAIGTVAEAAKIDERDLVWLKHRIAVSGCSKRDLPSS